MGTFYYGNCLKDQPARRGSESQPAVTKRPSTSDATLSKPPKRPRIDNDAHEVYSIASSSDLREEPRSASSPVSGRDTHGVPNLRSFSPGARKEAHDTQSLPSSGDKQTKGVEINEYRSTSKYVKVGKRARHRKKPGQQSNGQTEQERENTPHSRKAAPRPAFKPHRPLISQTREVPGDHIEDDEVEIFKATPRPRTHGMVTSKTYGTDTFTKMRFEAPDDSNESDGIESGAKDHDEIAELLASNKHKSGVQESKAHREYRATKGTKRSAVSSDELQILHNPKRRLFPSHRGNIPKTNFVPEAMSGRQNGNHVFHVKRAVCEPCFIYPAQLGMYEGTAGASNTPCFLLPKNDDARAFRVIAAHDMELDQLEWITPNLSKVTKLTSNGKLPIVQLRKKPDVTTKLSTGASLLIEFETVQEAKRYVDLCKKANEELNLQSTSDTDLTQLLTKRLDTVKLYNMTKPPPPAGDAEVLTRTEAKGDHSKQSMHSTSVLSEKPRQPVSSAQRKVIREQMRGEDDLKNTTPVHPTSPHQNAPMTPAEEKQLRNLLEDDDGDDKEADERRPRIVRDSHSLTNERVSASQSRRSLRSSKPALRSPSPVPERWTEKNLNWAKNRDWMIPLIYERTTINVGDIERLDEGQFLNDAIISFYAKYLHRELEQKDAELAKKVYIFNSFFWETLRVKGYDGVKSWTAKVDLLSFDYIIVPINQNAHWYLAIICNPGALLPRDESEADAEETAMDEHEHDGEVPLDGAAEARVASITSDLSQVSIEDQPGGRTTINLEEPKRTPSGKKSKASRKRATIRKYDPKAPRVITLDSLDGTHSPVATTLRGYLIKEIKERKGINIEVLSPIGTAAKDIPMQLNFTDCGVYLLGYIEEFMKDPHRFTRRILQQEKRDWDVNAPALRAKIRELIFNLQKKYQREETRRRRERKLLSNQKKSKAQNSTAGAQPPSNSRSGSEQSAQRPSHSPAADSHKETSKGLGSPGRRINDDQKLADPKLHNSKSPRRRQSATLAQSQTSENDGPNVNASMIVHPNESIEMDNEHSAEKSDGTPHAVNPMTDTGLSRETPQLVISVPVRKISRLSKTPTSTIDDYDERKFLQPIKSSPPASLATTSKQNADLKASLSRKAPSKNTIPEQDDSRSSLSSSAAASKGNSAGMTILAVKTPDKNAILKKKDDTRSPYFSSSTVKPSSAKVAPARRNDIVHTYHAINSSSDEEKNTRYKGKGGKIKKSHTIDLTDD